MDGRTEQALARALLADFEDFQSNVPGKGGSTEANTYVANRLAKSIYDHVRDGGDFTFRFRGDRTCDEVNADRDRNEGDLYYVTDEGTLTGEPPLDVKADSVVVWDGKGYRLFLELPRSSSDAYTKSETDALLALKEGKGSAAKAVSVHEAKDDPHPQYVKSGELGSYVPLEQVNDRKAWEDLNDLSLYSDNSHGMYSLLHCSSTAIGEHEARSVTVMKSVNYNDGYQSVLVDGEPRHTMPIPFVTGIPVVTGTPDFPLGILSKKDGVWQPYELKGERIYYLYNVSDLDPSFAFTVADTTDPEYTRHVANDGSGAVCMAEHIRVFLILGDYYTTSEHPQAPFRVMVGESMEAVIVKTNFTNFTPYNMYELDILTGMFGRVIVTEYTGASFAAILGRMAPPPQSDG